MYIPKFIRSSKFYVTPLAGYQDYIIQFNNNRIRVSRINSVFFSPASQAKELPSPAEKNFKNWFE